MKSTSAIRLDYIKSQQLVDKQNDLLSNYSDYMTESKIHDSKQVTDGIRASLTFCISK